MNHFLFYFLKQGLGGDFVKHSNSKLETPSPSSLFSKVFLHKLCCYVWFILDFDLLHFIGWSRTFELKKSSCLSLWVTKARGTSHLPSI